MAYTMWKAAIFLNQEVTRGIIFLGGRSSPMRVIDFSFIRFLDHTLRRTAVGRTLLDE